MSAHTSDHRSSSSYSGRSPEEIEAEIGHTREQLGRTIHVLESRLSPRQRVHAAADSARNWVAKMLAGSSNAVTPGITRMIRFDHTHVIALFRRFKPETSVGKKQALVANACLALEVHAQLEEEIFYPALREAVGHNEMLDKSVPEHDEMKNLIADVRAMNIVDPNFNDRFYELMRAVLHHVADEESSLLPLAEVCIRERLGELGLEMTRRRIQLLRPHLAEVAVTTARSFPVLTVTSAVGFLALGWLLFRTSRSAPRRFRS